MSDAIPDWKFKCSAKLSSDPEFRRNIESSMESSLKYSGCASPEEAMHKEFQRDFLNLEGKTRVDSPSAIRNLEDIRFFPNLKSLHSSRNEITSLEPLRAVPLLETFTFRTNQVRNIVPLAPAKIFVGWSWGKIR